MLRDLIQVSEKERENLKLYKKRLDERAAAQAHQDDIQQDEFYFLNILENVNDEQIVTQRFELPKGTSRKH